MFEYTGMLLQDSRPEHVSLPKVVKLLTDAHSVRDVFLYDVVFL